MIDESSKVTSQNLPFPNKNQRQILFGNISFETNRLYVSIDQQRIGRACHHLESVYQVSHVICPEINHASKPSKGLRNDQSLSELQTDLPKPSYTVFLLVGAVKNVYLYCPFVSNAGAEVAVFTETWLKKYYSSL
jgi:hypothetical protein